MSIETTFASVLKNNGYSHTKPRLVVFEALQKNQPLNQAQLASKLAKKIDRASVYRSLELFEKLGIVQRVWLGYKSHLELSELFSAHHHHLTCYNCGKVIAVEDHELEEHLAQIAKKFGFTPQNHQVEINGTCLACS